MNYVLKRLLEAFLFIAGWLCIAISAIPTMLMFGLSDSFSGFLQAVINFEHHGGHIIPGFTLGPVLLLAKAFLCAD